MALSKEVKSAIIKVAGQWSETQAKAQFKIDPKVKYVKYLRDNFDNHYAYLATYFADDIPDSES